MIACCNQLIFHTLHMSFESCFWCHWHHLLTVYQNIFFKPASKHFRFILIQIQWNNLERQQELIKHYLLVPVLILSLQFLLTLLLWTYCCMHAAIVSYREVMILTSLTRNFFVLWTKDYMNSHMVADCNYREKRSSAINKKKKKKGKYLSIN